MYMNVRISNICGPNQYPLRIATGLETGGSQFCKRLVLQGEVAKARCGARDVRVWHVWKPDGTVRMQSHPRRLGCWSRYKISIPHPALARLHRGRNGRRKYFDALVLVCRDLPDRRLLTRKRKTGQFCAKPVAGLGGALCWTSCASPTMKSCAYERHASLPGQGNPVADIP